MRYRKKPVVIEAFMFGRDEYPEWFTSAVNSGDVKILNAPFGEQRPITIGKNISPGMLKIKTIEGWVQCKEGNFVIKGVAGEIYPCRFDIFTDTYEEES